MESHSSASFRSARFRQGTLNDLDLIEAIAEQVHPTLPERRDVVAEKIRLYPAGCLIVENRSGPLGYAFAHPWLLGHAPALDSFLGSIPLGSDCLFIHDIALLEPARGHGLGRRLVDKLARLGTPLSLVAVYSTEDVWKKIGFRPAPTQHLMDSYGAATYMVRAS